MLKEGKKNYRNFQADAGRCFELHTPVLDSRGENGEDAMNQSPYITYAPNVTKEMYEAAYWLRKCDGPEYLLMDKKEIDRFNAEILHKKALVNDIWKMATEFDGTKRKMKWAEQEPLEDPVYRTGKKLRKEDFAEYQKNILDMESRERQQMRYGICVRRADIKIWPEPDIVSADAADIYYDKFQVTAARVNTPVLIDGETADGTFYHVIMYDYEGWGKREHFAVCPNRDTWMKAQQMKDFLVVTVPRLRIEQCRQNQNGIRTGEELTMGTKVRLLRVGEVEKTELAQCTWGCYVAELPAVKKDGTYQNVYVTIPENAGVHEGYLPYTTKNVLKTAEQFLGNCYGWGGMFDSVDCSQLVQEVYSCFGLQLPRDAGSQAEAPGIRVKFSPDMTEEERGSMLDALPPGSALFFPGHTMIYLGKEKEEYYVLSSVGSLRLPGEKAVREVRSVIINNLSVQRRNGNTWKEELTDAVVYVSPARI
ncbi:C40 family peptidase [Hespellia stercorisuis]|uniref:SH3 domain (SH3b1 type) n=1 Tax=Hespellia stercorisuis DSM 15480 TaxID=1121950 RepID=A0A1M6LAB2_9FIRM|nr:NlpC/P60 family protein [Hespellia stercorisuis]SHJ68140.1 SH3 domain (SH3b1 type) [Hespellia stercorisuis DSM 15480]